MPEPALYGFDLWGEPIAPPKRGGKLAEEFLVPPFSVLNAREGWWQERKRGWLALGIRGEVGRSAKSFNTHDWMNSVADGQRGEGDGTSIFDPVICELSYRWFCPNAGHVLDPFAGGSVRGIVAAQLGMHYTGIELRPEQIASNQEQRAEVCDAIQPTWVAGDAVDVRKLAGGAAYDFLFSCPFYGDLERYSDDPRDLSTLDFPAFALKYKQCVAESCTLLRHNRFACFVVGDFRDRHGNYRDFVSLTIAAFREAGVQLYNEAILVTAVGSLPIRITKQFEASRKLGKTHQNVLVFVKGDGKAAAKAIDPK